MNIVKEKHPPLLPTKGGKHLYLPSIGEDRRGEYPYNNNMNELTQKARNLRTNMTDQERKFWAIVRKEQFHNYRFLRQYIIGNYIVDFICREKKIIIEIDGGQHSENVDYDIARTKFLESKGYKVIRFWNNDIDNNISGVYQKLEDVFDIHPPKSSL